MLMNIIVLIFGVITLASTIKTEKERNKLIKRNVTDT